MSLNLSKAKGLVVKVAVLVAVLLMVPVELLGELVELVEPLKRFVVCPFFVRKRLPPSRPNRNSLNRRFKGSLLGKISSVLVAADKLEFDEEWDELDERDVVKFNKLTLLLLLLLLLMLEALVWE